MTDLEKQLRKTKIIKMTAFLSLLLIFFFLLFWVDNLLISFVLALIMTYIFNPIVNSLERRGIQRIFSVMIIFFIFSITMGVLIAVNLPFLKMQINALKLQIPHYIEGTTRLLQKTEEHFSVFSGFSGISLSTEIKSLLMSFKSSLFVDLPTFLSKSLTTLILAPFFAFFMLKDGRTIFHKIMTLVPNSIFELFLNLQYQINEQMAQFVRARILEALIVGTVVWLGLLSFHFPFSFLLGSFAALMNLIPYVGPLIGAVPALLIALFQEDTSLSLLLVTLVYTFAQLIDIVFIIPMVVAKLVDLHPVTVVVVIIIGAQLLGVLGMLISIPIASALKVTLSSVYGHLTEFRS